MHVSSRWDPYKKCTHIKATAAYVSRISAAPLGSTTAVASVLALLLITVVNVVESIGGV